MPSLSLLLYWRDPTQFVPYNFRTKRFLSDFKLAVRAMSASSPRCYVTWLLWAARVSHALGLPSPGHIDRLVTRHYNNQRV